MSPRVDGIASWTVRFWFEIAASWPPEVTWSENRRNVRTDAAMTTATPKNRKRLSDRGCEGRPSRYVFTRSPVDPFDLHPAIVDRHEQWADDEAEEPVEDRAGHEQADRIGHRAGGRQDVDDQRVHQAEDRNGHDRREGAEARHGLEDEGDAADRDQEGEGRGAGRARQEDVE